MSDPFGSVDFFESTPTLIPDLSKAVSNDDGRNDLNRLSSGDEQQPHTTGHHLDNFLSADGAEDGLKFAPMKVEKVGEEAHHHNNLSFAANGSNDHDDHDDEDHDDEDDDDDEVHHDDGVGGKEEGDARYDDHDDDEFSGSDDHDDDVLLHPADDSNSRHATNDGIHSKSTDEDDDDISGEQRVTVEQRAGNGEVFNAMETEDRYNNTTTTTTTSSESPDTSSYVDQFETSEATPPPSPTVTESVSLATPKVESDLLPAFSSPSADTTTPTLSSGDGPVKMPKATTISPPTKIHRASNSSGVSGSVFAWLKQLNPRVWEVLLWRDPRLTASVLAPLLFVLICLARCSVFSVVSWLLLTAVLVASGARAVKFVMVRLHKGDDVHPCKDILDIDLLLSQQTVEDFAQAVVTHLNPAVNTIRDLVFVENFFRSFQFGLVLYAMTFIGAWFNGLTVLILAIVAAFTLPKVYEVNKSQIDQYVELFQSKVDDTYKLVQDKIPYMKSKPKVQ